MKVLVTDYAWPSLTAEREVLRGVGADLVVAETGSEAELTELARDVSAILTNWKQVPESALRNAERCVIVSRYGVGVDNIPVALATELGIVVANVPDFCASEVSDHAMALLLACARRLATFTEATDSGVWNLEFARGLPRLSGQVLGIVGFGRTARALAPKARAFGLDVMVYTPRIAPGVQEDGIAATNDLAELLATADYVSLNAPATSETRGLIGETELRMMKSTAYLINTARGSLIDEGALLQALDERWIAGAALDVLRSEPPPERHPFLGHPNVLLTPHVAFYSDAAIEELQEKAARNVASALAGQLPRWVVNPAVAKSPKLRLVERRRSPAID